MDRQVTASFLTLMDQAPATVSGYFWAAVKDIDAKFGKGYAAKNPALVGAYTQACAQDYHSSTHLMAIEILAEQVEGLAHCFRLAAEQKGYPPLEVDEKPDARFSS